MAVRIILRDGETTFTQATSAVATHGILGVYEWNPKKVALDEIAVFRMGEFVRAEVIKNGAVIEIVPGYCRQLADGQPKSSESTP